jgi:hypothetical protein
MARVHTSEGLIQYCCPAKNLLYPHRFRKRAIVTKLQQPKTRIRKNLDGCSPKVPSCLSTFLSRFVSWSTMGARYASVFPLPVSAFTRQSRPVSIAGMASFCTCVGAVNPSPPAKKKKPECAAFVASRIYLIWAGSTTAYGSRRNMVCLRHISS